MLLLIVVGIFVVAGTFFVAIDEKIQTCPSLGNTEKLLTATFVICNGDDKYGLFRVAASHWRSKTWMAIEHKHPVILGGSSQDLDTWLVIMVNG